MAVNPGLSALFEGLSTFGRQLPVVMGDAQRQADAEADRKWRDEERARQEASRARFAAAIQGLPELGQALEVGSPNLYAGGALDLNGPGMAPSGEQSFEQLLMGIGSRPVDPFAIPEIAENPAPDFADPANPTVEELVRFAGKPAVPPAAGPRRVSYADQANWVRSRITAPEDITIWSPYLNLLDEASKAEQAGDKIKRDAYAKAAQNELETRLTIFRENQQTARNNATIAGREANQKPTTKAPGNMSLPELEAQVTSLKQAIRDLKSQNAILNRDQINEVSKRLSQIYPFYVAAGGAQPLVDVDSGAGVLGGALNFFNTSTGGSAPGGAPASGSGGAERKPTYNPLTRRLE